MSELIQFATNHPMLSAAAVATTVIAIGYEIRMRFRGFAEVDPPQAVALINRGAMVLDTRSREQFNAGHIINARLLEPDQLESRLESLKNDLNQTIILCCESGMSSGRIAGMLHKHGFTSVHNLKGGIGAWRAENYPLESKASSKKGK